MANQAILVRLDGTATQSDVGALKKWLEREKQLEDRVRRGELRIQERAGTDEQGTPMGAGMDILLTLVNCAGAAVFAEVIRDVRQAVEAWRENRRQVESGDPPNGTVNPVDPDAE